MKQSINHVFCAVVLALALMTPYAGKAQGNPSAPQPTPAVQSQEPQEITEDYFYTALAPYGAWTNVPGYGLSWQPNAANDDASWTPYGTEGQWLYTDCGWYWLSSYTWGWCVFHYGRWFHDAQRGWLWWPSTVWAPSWVFWRSAHGYCGWAPLPPHSYYSQEKGLVYNGATVGRDYDFRLGADNFNFVPTAKLFNAKLEQFRLSAAQAAQIYPHTKVAGGVSSNNRTIVNDGIPVHQVARFAGGDIHLYKIKPVESVPVPGAFGEQILPDGETLTINRPHLNANVPSALRQGIWPVPSQVQPVAYHPPSIIMNENPLSYTPPADNDNSVIYVDTAGQNGPPVPTVTTAGPQDVNAPSGGGSFEGPAQSYWASWGGAPAPNYTPSGYMSPRQRSRERWDRKVDQPDHHREFNPPSQESHSGQNSGGQHAPSHEGGTSSPSHSPAPTAPAHTAPGGGGHSDGHGH